MKSVPCICFRFQHFINIILIHRCLTEDERIISGLSTGNDAPLEVREGGISRRGVFATARIPKGAWLCEYKSHRMFPQSEKSAIEREYDLNNEGSYIIETKYPVPGIGHMCWDATRKCNQLGRYLNHAQRPNAKVTRPFQVRGKSCIGFVACRDIDEGDEVVWDYGMRDQVWSGCRLVKGVVQKTEGMKEEEEGEEVKDEEKVTPAAPLSKKGKGVNYCMCPICKTGPHRKISNHLSQVHHLKPRERAKYLGDKRIIATPQQIKSKRTRPSISVRKSQRKINSIFHCITPSPVSSIASHHSQCLSQVHHPQYLWQVHHPQCLWQVGRCGSLHRDSPAPLSLSPIPSPTRVSLSPSHPPTHAGPSNSPASLAGALESPGPSRSAALSGKSTRNAPRFSLEITCLGHQHEDLDTEGE